MDARPDERGRQVRAGLLSLSVRGPGRLSAGAAAVALLIAVGPLASPDPAGAAKRTGRHLVVLKEGQAGMAARIIARARARRAGIGVRALRIATVRGSAAALAALRRDPAVKSVSREWTRDFQRMPRDPALTQPETAPGVPVGTPLQWALAREGFPAAWDVTTGAGTIVGLIDSGIEGDHPQLAPKLASAVAFGTDTDPRTDEEGHGTHVSGIACAATDDGVAIAGAGWDCRLALVKAPQLRDEDVINGIVDLVGRGAAAINMSFVGGASSAAIDEAIDFAVARGVVLVAAASNDEDLDQGSPASQLQPGNAPNLDQGRGLVVTAADFSDRRAGTGHGPQISLAAYGFFDLTTGPPGLISTYTSLPTQYELVGPPRPCLCRASFGDDNRYAYLQGTSMAAPQVSATAALISSVNPRLSALERVRLIKQTARRQGGWNADLGWGILDAGHAVDAARRIDRVRPVSRARALPRVRLRGGPATIRLRLSGRDPAGGAGLIPSGIRSYLVYARRGSGRFRLVRRTRSRRAALRVRSPGRYSFYTRARDAAGNLERAPARADSRTRVSR